MISDFQVTYSLWNLYATPMGSQGTHVGVHEIKSPDLLIFFFFLQFWGKESMWLIILLKVGEILSVGC